MQPPVRIDVRIDQTHREVAVTGELDIATRASVTDATDELNSHGDGDINLDLDEVTFIDAAGVSAVVAADNEQAKRHTSLNTRSSSRIVRRVFAMCRLSWMLTRWTRSTPAEPTDSGGHRSPGPEAMLRARIAHLEIALGTNRRIGVAVGILMAERKLLPDAAYQLLVAGSQNSNRKLHDIAEIVILTGAMP